MLSFIHHFAVQNSVIVNRSRPMSFLLDGRLSSLYIGVYNLLGSTCALTRAGDTDDQPWCGPPTLIFPDRCQEMATAGSVQESPELVSTLRTVAPAPPAATHFSCKTLPYRRLPCCHGSLMTKLPCVVAHNSCHSLYPPSTCLSCRGFKVHAMREEASGQPVGRCIQRV